jgi:hypothetical protein
MLGLRLYTLFNIFHRNNLYSLKVANKMMAALNGDSFG